MYKLEEFSKKIYKKWGLWVLDREIARMEAFLKRHSSSRKRALGRGIKGNFSQKINEKKAKINLSVRKLIQISKRNPKVIIKFIEKHNTPVFQTILAQKLLKIINEKEGFIPPKKGIKALFLNFVIPLVCGETPVVAFNSPEMFVINPFKLNVYKLIEHVHIWHAFRANMPGYKQKAIENYKKLQKSPNGIYSKQLTLSEIQDVRDVAERGLDACAFLIEISNEYEGGKFAVGKMSTSAGARI